jgi:hypothetical protein
MRAINHFTIKGMETVSISDKLKIEHEGELELLSKLLKVEDFFCFSCKSVPESRTKSLQS